MSANKTTPTDASPQDFIDTVEPEAKRADAKVLDAMFRRVTGEEPRMWGPSMIGYGQYHYKYDSGREGDWMRTGFSPRKAKHSLYLMGGYCDDATGEKNDALLAKLGKHSRGKSCLYINKLADVDLDVLEELVRTNWQSMNRVYPPEG
ncbi:DUF1801 domain-containing protein [Aurantiacibacter gangjinensis]|uniref:Uncharacterized protein n=1 Tax=Aurantiacibacter gangjinensis TaxID=502682 RepID=A0A0G9MPE8_9SPHN|nr:DUF1801 domain-containing protein [Aurantiacibacter gangjinensis]APE28383.1 hypothetical protein BMF35_a1554 [Aurantiacibacter gangjinensis]KLE32611.1 hypothetical protein AAW01_00645 [Aurantiacibacter gangjinensis]